MLSCLTCQSTLENLTICSSPTAGTKKLGKIWYSKGLKRDLTWSTRETPLNSSTIGYPMLTSFFPEPGNYHVFFCSTHSLFDCCHLLSIFFTRVPNEKDRKLKQSHIHKLKFGMKTRIVVVWLQCYPQAARMPQIWDKKGTFNYTKW